MLTPLDMLHLSEPLEFIYQQIVDSLLINIAKHFNTGKNLPTQLWQLKKLAEVGQVSKESAKIIADNIGQNTVLIAAALQQAVIMATKDSEPELQKAVKLGFLDGPSGNPLVSENIKNVLLAYESQAQEKMNLVNTTMLESTLDQFRKVIFNTVAIEQKLSKVQNVLNVSAGKVATGVSSRTQALREALSKLSDEGITGFYDKSGRKWSPEAYVNMDIRTTVHNTSIEAAKTRQQEFGTDIFRVSRHSGARPLCYPYQGRYFSWSNKSGTFTDGEGKQHRYYPISSTSYGKPAGLFGINCGHTPITVIPGVSIPRDREPQNKEENDRVYTESQQQRKLERDVRYAKRKAAMLEKAGDKEGFEKEALKIKNKQAEYNAFCKTTGRTKRLDRTQVFEYNRNVSSKTTSAANNAVHRQYKDYLGTKTVSQTVSKVKHIFDNGDKWLLDGYVKAVKKGDISALTGIDTYLDTARNIESQLVGTTAINGVGIKGYTSHFVDRIIGQTSTPHKGMRTGVKVEDVLHALQNGEAKPILTRADGKQSQQIIGSNNVVTINPKTGKLVQTNPKGENNKC